jgi:ADP-ribose pyrophosphatase YjhB (NUDIX family)
MKNPLLIAADRLRRAYWFVVRPVSVGVLGIVVDEAGRVLLVEHTYRHGWYLPGGGVRRKEALDDGLRRELREEVGIELTAEPQLLGIYWNFAEQKSDYAAVFVVEHWRRKPARSLEIAADGFFAPDELPADTSPAARRRVAEHAAGRLGIHGAW